MERRGGGGEGGHDGGGRKRRPLNFVCLPCTHGAKTDLKFKFYLIIFEFNFVTCPPRGVVVSLHPATRIATSFSSFSFLANQRMQKWGSTTEKGWTSLFVIYTE